jgi:polar amino acid transport system substrate-binding protein
MGLGSGLHPTGRGPRRKERDVNKRLVGIVGVLAVTAMIGAACGGGDNEPAGGGGASAAGSAPAVTTLEAGVLSVGSCLDYPPFESVKGGDEVGFDVDVTEAIAKKLGLQVKWVRANFDTIFTAVAGGQFDMVAAAVTATGKTGEERAQTVAFSDYYYNSRQSLAVNTQETPDIQSTDDLGDGDAVGVQRGTTGKIWAEENLQPNGVEIRTYTAAPDSFRDLQAGVIQGVINDEPSSVEIVTEFPGLEVVEPIDTNEKYAFAFAKDTPDLVAAVNGALRTLIDDGTYATIYEKWFPGAPVPDEFQAA